MPATPKSRPARCGELYPRSGRPGRSLFPTVRMCPVDPPLRTLAVLGAATRALVTTYTDPGDRVLLIEPPVVARAVGSPQRPSPVRLDWASVVEAVARLGRGASTHPAPMRVDPAAPHTSPADDDQTDRSAESESEPGLGLDDPDQTIPISADLIAALDSGGPTADKFDLIIAAVGAAHPGHGPVTTWAHNLTPTGTLAIITHGDRTYGQLAGPERDLHRAARLAGLTMSDRLILVHESPLSTAASDDQRVAFADTGHRRIHSTVLVFRTHLLDTNGEAGND